MQINHRLLIVTSVGAAIVILDQVTKWLARSYLTQGSILISPFFRLRFFQNPGIALGISLSSLIFYPLFIFLVVGFLIYFSKKTSGAFTYSFLILAAAFSNLIDRLRFGYVVDFIEFYPTRGPIFNLADIVIVVGILIIALKTIKKK